MQLKTYTLTSWLQNNKHLNVHYFFIVWIGISRKLAAITSIVPLLICLLSGMENSAPVSSFFFSNAVAATLPDAATTKSANGFHSDNAKVQVTEIALQKTSATSDRLFTRHYGEELGITTKSDMSVSYKFISPFSHNWPVASADVNNDGWIDIVFGTEKGIFLFKNIQGKRFEPIPVTLPGNHQDAMNVALVDMNNDNQPDLFVTRYRGGNYIIYNQNGEFLAANQHRLPDMGSTILNATAFGDLDRDGDMDIVAGNWTAGPWTRLPGESSRNAILWNQGNQFSVERMEGLPGETLSILISDINQDGYPDVMDGNDFNMPEFYYLGQPDGKLKLIKRSDNIFPITTFSTMSIDSGDTNNDLAFEIYTAQASGFTSTNPTNRASMLPLQPISKSCDEYEDNAWKKRCLTRLKHHKIIFDARVKRDPKLCLAIDDAHEKQQCLAYLLLEKATRFDNNPELCEQFKKDWSDLAHICKLGQQPPAQYSQQQINESLKQVLGRNMFYTPNKKGGYSELAENVDVDITGWSWNAKFADLDNDEWQDLYIVNGFFRSEKRETNVFFRNQQGKTFSNDTRAAGLENYLAAGAYTYIDYDNDGDLDIITPSFDGPIWIYTNNTQKRGIIFELNDREGNRSGIGSRIIIHYGKDGSKHQIREIKASGGFLSYDAPRAHFGLGDYSEISRVEVIWSTGEKTQLNGEFKAGHTYKIERSGI